MDKQALTANTGVDLTPAETEVVFKLPDVYRALADWHLSQEAMAGAMDYTESAKYHDERATVLSAHADKLDEEMENG